MYMTTPTRENHTESLRGHFLVAMPSLREGFFAQSITYICDHSEHGAMGLVINQAVGLTLYDIFEHLNIACSDNCHRYNQVQVMAGGPVGINRGFVLHRNTEQSWDATLEITPEISLTSSQDIIFDIAADKGPEDCVVALGYAGWGGGQLESEMIENSWLTLPANSNIIFNTPPEQRLALAVKALGIDINLMSSAVGHA